MKRTSFAAAAASGALSLFQTVMASTQEATEGQEGVEPELEQPDYSKFVYAGATISLLLVALGIYKGTAQSTEDKAA